MSTARDLAELVRLPAALTVPGDVLAGAAAAGTLTGWRPVALAASSTCLYWAGMALNDYADRELDAEERPERPIPSGRVTPRTALGISGGLTMASLVLAATTGRRALAVAVPLAGAVWTYDLVAKSNAAGPFVMGASRFLDVLLGGSAAPRRAVPAALAIGGHTTALTVLSRGEVHGSTPATAGLALATSAAVATAVAVGAARASGRSRLARIAAAAMAGTYALNVGRAQLAAYRRPDAQTVRSATRSGIHGLVPLQGALIARQGAVGVAAALMSAVPALRAAAKVMSPT